MMTKEEILHLVEQEDIEFIRLQFTDMFGDLKNVAVTSTRLEHVFEHGHMIRGSAMCGKYNYETEDLYLKPDLDTFTILPWRPQQGKVARILCDVYREDGSVYELSSRNILKNVIEKTKQSGYTFLVDPNCEFFLFHTDENGNPTTITHEMAGFMDVGPVDFGENARRELVLNLQEMGFEIESSHHEMAPSQHEIDFKSDEPLGMADSIVTFKSAVRSTVKRFGMHATFMPKPRKDAAGSGMHLNLAIYKEGENVLNSYTENEEIQDELNWFIGGIMKYAPEMCAITNPIVNSYKRLVAGYEAPRDIVWTHKNLNALLKVQKRHGEDTKVCLRFPDSAANPYLALAVCIAAGIAGIEEKIEAGPFIPTCYELKDEIKQLPGTLREAVVRMKHSDFMKNVLGESFVALYVEAKMKEWNAYMEHVSKWELDEYLNRF